MNNGLLSIGDVGRLIGVPRHKIEYALASGYIQEPKTRFLGRRCFDSEDVRRVAVYFGMEKKNEGEQKETHV